MKSLNRWLLPVTLLFASPLTSSFASSIALGAQPVAKQEILNVSFDPTRELFADLNQHFLAQRQLAGKAPLEVKQSHGGSGSQSQAVVDGLKADVVTLALAPDIDKLVDAKLVNEGWQERLPNHASPYHSTVVFLVRAGNPKLIKDWDDLTRSDVAVITPNPKTSGGARYNYLAAWSFAADKFKSDEGKTQAFVQSLFQRVKVLDSGARGSTITFAEKGEGDVLITWEAEAHQAIKAYEAQGFELVTPSLSILAEPSVAIVDKVVDEKGSREIAEDYLKYLYSEQAQTLIAEHYFRPSNQDLAKQYETFFRKIPLVEVEKDLGGWKEVQGKHFADGGIFDQIQKPQNGQ